jgi:hypothetical protein
MKIRPSLLALCSAGAVAVGAAPAAAQTLGEVAPAGASAVICPEFCEVAQVATGPGTPSYVVPPGGGVITSWTFRALKAGTAYMELDEYVNGNTGVISDTLVQKFAPGELKTTPTRNPVYGGEHVGVAVNGTSAAFHSANSGDVVELIGPPIVVPGGGGGGLPGPIPAGPGQQPGGLLVDMEVTLEPDADHDEYGDLTQDLCPTDPKHHDACPKPPPSGGGGNPGGKPGGGKPSGGGNQGSGSNGSTGGSGGQTGSGVVSSSSPAIAGVPHITLSASKRESIRHGLVTLTLSSDSDVTASVAGLVKQRSVHKPYRLRSGGQSVGANTPTTLKLKLTRKQLKSIRKRLRKHRKAVATVTVTVRNAAGATSAASLSIRLAR